MKIIFRFIFALVCSLALSASTRAELHQVTALSTSATKVIIIPGNKVMWVTIQNIGSNQANLSADGGSSHGGADPSTGSTGNGIVLAANQSITFYGPYVQGVIISGVTASSTTTLNVSTNAPVGNSSFPTN